MTTQKTLEQLRYEFEAARQLLQANTDKQAGHRLAADFMRATNAVRVALQDTTA